ncbi:MAG: insulinase family protein [Woeseiaceae bacterium]|nr:insulinase family protein [Woeseiaceae bacterium]
MTLKHILPLALLAILAVGLIASQARADDDIASQVDIQYEMFTLDNGLTVLVHSDHSVPTVFVGMWYGVGSADEPQGKTGFAHLFEHLMFQGTANRDGEFFGPFIDAGATGMNGTTSEDRTNYFATVPTGALDMALWMESDRMSYLLGAVNQEALDEQRGVVQNEKRQRENRPYSGMADRIRAGVYPVDHPYRHSVIGSMEDLDAASLEDVHEWFGKYYGASNVVLVLAGDISLETAKEKVAYYFAEAPSGVELVKTQQWIPTIDHNRIEKMYDKVGQSRVSRTWVLPGMNDRDTTLMYLVNETLVGNKNSPLYSRLVDELQIATSVTGYAHGRVLSGEYSLTIDVKPGVDPQQVLDVVDQVLADYLDNGPSPEIAENAKLGVNMYMLGSLESKATIGRFLAEGQLYAGDPLQVKTDIAWLNEATPEELQAVANRWLSRNYYQLTVDPFPELVGSEPAVDRAVIPAVTEVADIEFPEIATAELDNGMQLVVARRGSIPLVDVSIQVNTGNSANPAQAPGTASAVFGLLTEGTGQYDANELAAALDSIAMSPRISAGQERSSFGYRILRSNLDASLELAAEMLRNPTFPQHELDKIKQQLFAVLATIEKNPSRFTGSLFSRAIYGEASPLGMVWTPELVADFSVDTLRSFHRREVAPDNMTIYMIGDISLETARASVESAFGSWRHEAQSGRKPIGDAVDKGPRVILVHQAEAVQSTIMAGHSIPPFDPQVNTELAFVNGVFGGTFESRINMNLREDKAWSYGARSGVARNASGDQTFAVSTSVQTDKTMESMQEIKRELDEYVSSRPATAEEVERVRLNRTRSLPGSYSSNRGFLSSIVSSDSYGLPFDYAEGTADRLNAVTLEEVNTRATSLIRPGELTWVIVGDLDQIEDKVRSLDFGPVEVWDGFGNRIR